jgi:hypothetical protein
MSKPPEATQDDAAPAPVAPRASSSLDYSRFDKLTVRRRTVSHHASGARTSAPTTATTATPTTTTTTTPSQDTEDSPEDLLRRPTSFESGAALPAERIRRVVYLSAADVAACRAVPLAEREVWQVAVKRLRCFLPGEVMGSVGAPVRPHCVLVSRLHPVPALVAKAVCRPPEAAPATPTVLAQIVRAILTPESEGAPAGAPVAPAARPTHVTFSDAELAGVLRGALAQLLRTDAGARARLRGLARELGESGGGGAARWSLGY